VAKVGKLSSLGKVGDLCNQLGKLPCGVAHPLKIGNRFRQFVPPCILKENIDETNDRSDGGTQLLPQKSGNCVVEAAAAHGRSPARVRSASIFCRSRGSSTGFVS